MAHTPGPWAVEAYKATPNTPYGVRGGESTGFQTVAHVFPSSRADRAIAKANARLIAAAPRMLESCRDLINSLEEWQRQYDPDQTDTLTATRVNAAVALLRELEG